jgi:cation diffusion facilitator family transporter
MANSGKAIAKRVPNSFQKMSEPKNTESKTSIYAAIAGNLLIAATKAVAAFFTGSSAMLSEAIHSVVDTGNGVLMLYGIRQSKKPPDETHQFGYGRELYFWSLIVALSIFAVGGGVSVYEGVSRLRHPAPTENPVWNYAVLTISFVFESVTWYFGWRTFGLSRKKGTILEGIIASKDPTTFSVLLEDSTAIVGLVIAFFGILLGQLTGVQYFDGIASILIGLLLCLVAWLMGHETKELIIGEAVDAETQKGIRRIVEAEPSIEKVVKAMTVYIGPNDVSLTLELLYRQGVSAIEIGKTIRRVERDVRAKYPHITRIFYAANSLAID